MPVEEQVRPAVEPRKAGEQVVVQMVLVEERGEERMVVVVGQGEVGMAAGEEGVLRRAGGCVGGLGRGVNRCSGGWAGLRVTSIDCDGAHGAAEQVSGEEVRRLVAADALAVLGAELLESLERESEQTGRKRTDRNHSDRHAADEVCAGEGNCAVAHAWVGWGRGGG